MDASCISSNKLKDEQLKLLLQSKRRSSIGRALLVPKWRGWMHLLADICGTCSDGEPTQLIQVLETAVDEADNLPIRFLRIIDQELCHRYDAVVFGLCDPTGCTAISRCRQQCYTFFANYFQSLLENNNLDRGIGVVGNQYTGLSALEWDLMQPLLPHIDRILLSFYLNHPIHFLERTPGEGTQSMKPFLKQLQDLRPLTNMILRDYLARLTRQR